ncbi:unnamed protein product [Cladocopium goreaui]|uniref:RING-type domain-containing protein n=1 Tax=Cladocopium goreaui TaxID=2562237 RepID=A0A9P1CHM1_9DINO|nr:unnamed protein product [Cladocopium goreaui]
MGACESFLYGKEPETVNGANGQITKGMRVQTQYTIAEGGDGRWYMGKVTRLYGNNRCRIYYDDGDTWTGNAMEVYSMQGPPPSASAGAPGMPPVGGVPMGMPMGAPVVQAMVVSQPVKLPPIPSPTPADSNENTCPVCQVNKMDMVLQCGHRLCGNCTKDIVEKRNGQCPVCRVQITQVIRSYN